MTTKPASVSGAADATRIVRRIIAHHFGQHRSGTGAERRPAKIERLSGGLTNLVFSVQVTEGNLIVRLGTEAGKLSAFMKEQWAIGKAREAGVPAPEVLEVGSEAVPLPYMIARHAKGTEGTFHPERMRIIRQMGQYAAVINSIQTTGFGSTFE